jgi:hypothetical protein
MGEVYSKEYGDGDETVSVNISGDGNVVAATAFFPNADMLILTIFRFGLDIWENTSSLRVWNSSTQLQIRLSFDGSIILVLSAGRVNAYALDENEEWEQTPIDSSMSSLDALALSGNGQVFAVADSSQTTVFANDVIMKGWVQRHTIERGARDLALDNSGCVLAIAELGSLTVWQQVTPESQYTFVEQDLHEENSEFGTSLALASYSDTNGLLAVGAPAHSGDKDNTIGEYEGSVHIYRVRGDTSK